MKTTLGQSTPTAFIISIMIWLGVMIAASFVANAQTLVSGSVSGNWSPSGNPYVVVDNVTVPSGQTLTIQPGVTVIMGEGLQIAVSGGLLAVGTPTSFINIRGSSPSNFWAQILVSYGTAQESQFRYCNISEGNTAIHLEIRDQNATMTTEISNCVFTNCTMGILGEAQGISHQPGPGPVYTESPTLTPRLSNCRFENSGNGCRFYTLGDAYSQGSSVANSNAKLFNNVFLNLAGTAIQFDNGASVITSYPIVVNCVVIKCAIGIDFSATYDLQVKDSILCLNGEGVKRAGSLGSQVGFNCFYGNDTNFVGYPSGYGHTVLQNRNGTPCDVAYNIIQDPLFVATNDMHLAASSPCIDAGAPDWAFTDMCFPPSQGTQFPDLGAFGGPDAANWLDVVPKVPVQASLTKSNNVIQLVWGAIPRSEYQVQCVTNLGTGDVNKWLNFTNGKVLAAEKLTMLTVATNSTQTNVFFRVESLGRSPGN